MRLELFDVSWRWSRQRTQSNDGTSFREQRNFFFCLPFNSSALYYLQTPTRRYRQASTPPQFLPISGDRDVSLPPSLEWHVWSSSSGNNCNAVHRSLSSGASLCSGTVGPSPCPILSAKLTCAISFDYWPLECVTSFRCITLEWHFWPSQRSVYNNCTRMLRAILNKSRMQYPIKCCTITNLLSPISKNHSNQTNKTCRTLLEDKNQLISDFLQWTNKCWATS